jgi:hypothetical protein
LGDVRLGSSLCGGVLPTFLAMRGIAMLRIAELIIEKRHSNNAHSILQMA